MFLRWCKMLQLNQFLDGSDNWDTHWARHFLKVPQDKLDAIAEWSAHKIGTTDNTSHKRDKFVSTAKEQFFPKAVSEKLSQSNSEKNLANPSGLQQTENKLSRSASLNYLDLIYKPSDCIPLKSANSAPNILALSNNIATAKHSDIDLQKTKSSRPKFNPIDRLKSAFTRAPKLKEMDPFSFSQPEMNYKSSSNVATLVKELPDHILNHKYLKGYSTSSVVDKGISGKVPKRGRDRPLENRIPLLDKKVSAYESRAVSNEKNSKQDLTEGQKSSNILQASKAAELLQRKENISYTNSTGHKSNKNYPKRDETSQNSDEESEINNSRDENGSRLDKHSQPRDQLVVEKSCKSNADQDESFGSQVMPCGQPLPVASDLTKRAHVEVLEKSACIVTASVENSDRGTTQNAPPRSSGTKRKRKSKTNSPKKLKGAQTIDIHYTAQQVRNMLEIIKMLNSQFQPH